MPDRNRLAVAIIRALRDGGEDLRPLMDRYEEAIRAEYLEQLRAEERLVEPAAK